MLEVTVGLRVPVFVIEEPDEDPGARPFDIANKNLAEICGEE